MNVVAWNSHQCNLMTPPPESCGQWPLWSFRSNLRLICQSVSSLKSLSVLLGQIVVFNTVSMEKAMSTEFDREPLLPHNQDTGQESLSCLKTNKEDPRCKCRTGECGTSRAAHSGVEHNDEKEKGSDATLPEQAPENKIGPSDMTMVTSLENCKLENGNEQDDLFRAHFGFDMDREIDLNVQIQGEFHVTLLYVCYFPS